VCLPFGAPSLFFFSDPAVGVACGLGVVWGVWYGRTKWRNRTRLLAAILSSAISVGSAVAFSDGCNYIKYVWYSGEYIGTTSDEYTVISFFGWLILCTVFHFVSYRLTLRKLKESMLDATVCVSTTEGEATSQGEEEAKKNWRYQSQVFEPPKNVVFAASELTKATAQAAFFTVTGSLSFCSPTSRSRSAEYLNGNRGRANTGSSKASVLSDEGYKMNTSEANDDSLKCCVAANDLFAVEGVNEPTSEGALRHDDDDDDECQDGSVADRQMLGDLTEISTACPSLRKYSNVAKKIEGGVNVDDDAEAATPNNDPSLWFMIKSSSCCGKRKYYNAPPRKPWECAVTVLKWTLWSITTVSHLYLTIINIGATVQQTAVRAALPSTYSTFYPADYITGTMCAWNESSPHADIRTFDSLDDVMAANYSVVHCGACGSCSNWNDLSLQWTTRSYLAELGQEWYVDG
jgi:hypothetical protein